MLTPHSLQDRSSSAFLLYSYGFFRGLHVSFSWRFIASEDVLNLEAFAFLPEQPFSGAALSPQLCPDDDES